MSEATMQLNRGLVVSPYRFFGRPEISKSHEIALHTDTRTPTLRPASAGNAFVGTGTSSEFASIARVFGGTTNAKISTATVQPVPVDVVNLNIPRHSQNGAVEIDRSAATVSSSNAANRVGGRCARIYNDTPVLPVDQVDVLLINERHVTASQRNSANTVECFEWFDRANINASWHARKLTEVGAKHNVSEAA